MNYTTVRAFAFLARLLNSKFQGMLATRFNQFDQSRKGALDRVELERFLRDLGVPLSSAQVSRFAEGVNAKRIEGSGTEGRVTLKVCSLVCAVNKQCCVLNHFTLEWSDDCNWL